MLIRSSLGSKGAWKGHVLGCRGKQHPAGGEGDGWSHHSRQGQPLKPTQLHFPGLSPNTESLHTNTVQAISSEIPVSSVFPYRSTALGVWLGFFFLFFKFFIIKKNLSSSFQEKLDVWPLCPLQGKYFIVIFLSSPPLFGSEILPHKQEFKNVCWLVKEKGPTSHFPRKSQKCWIFEKTFGFRPKENFNS